MNDMNRAVTIIESVKGTRHPTQIERNLMATYVEVSCTLEENPDSSTLAQLMELIETVVGGELEWFVNWARFYNEFSDLFKG